jgi:hypothetical protein
MIALAFRPGDQDADSGREVCVDGFEGGYVSSGEGDGSALHRRFAGGWAACARSLAAAS